MSRSLNILLHHGAGGDRRYFPKAVEICEIIHQAVSGPLGQQWHGKVSTRQQSLHPQREGGGRKLCRLIAAAGIRSGAATGIIPISRDLIWMEDVTLISKYPRYC